MRTPLHVLGATLAASLILTSAALSPLAVGTASAATPTKCSKLRGTNLATGSAVRVVRLKLPTLSPRGANAGTENRSGLFSCSLPNGPVRQIATAGQSYFKGQAGTPVERSTAKIGISTGHFVTVIESDETLMGESFLTERVVNAATGRRAYTYLNVNSETVATGLTAPLRTVLSPTGILVGLFPVVGAEGTQKTDRLVAFTNSKGQVLDTAPSGSIAVSSIMLTGNVVSWSDAGVAKSTSVE